MTQQPNKTPLIDAQTASFLQTPVSINVAARDAGNRPDITRAAGCRVAADGNSLTIFLDGVHNQTLLENLRENQTLAIVFSRPSTHKTIQLKANNATIVAITEDDHAAIRTYRQSFMEELHNLGFPVAFCEAIIPPINDKYVAIRFTPDLAYTQTPGPNAGKKLSV